MRYWYIVNCSQNHPGCPARHIWYWNEEHRMWKMHEGSRFKSREEAEASAFAVVTNGHQNLIGCVAAVEEEEIKE